MYELALPSVYESYVTTLLPLLGHIHHFYLVISEIVITSWKKWQKSFKFILS